MIKEFIVHFGFAEFLLNCHFVFVLDSDFGEISGFVLDSDFGEISGFVLDSDFGEISGFVLDSDFGEISGIVLDSEFVLTFRLQKLEWNI